MLERAFKLYDGEDYYSSSIELNKAIEGESGDSEPNKQKAEFWMGKALYNLKYYSASLSYFDRIVQKGPSHAYYNATLKWLASLSRTLPDSTGILDKIGKYNRAELDQPALEKVRDELYFLLGKFYYQKGNFKEAVELFNTVPTTERVLRSGQAVRGRDPRPRVPGQAGRRVVQGGAPHRGREPAIRASSRSRISPTCRWRAPSIRPGSSSSRPSTSTASRTTRRSGRTACSSRRGRTSCSSRRATRRRSATSTPSRRRTSRTTSSPRTSAEGLTVKATIYFYNCLYDRAQEAIDEFNAIYPTVFAELKKLIAGTTDNGQLFDVAVKIRKETSGLPEQVERAARGVLGDRSLARRFEYVEELDNELKLYDKADAAWRSTNIAQTVFADLTLQRSLAVNEAGDLARRRIKRLTEELSQLIKRVIKIEFEILQGEKGALEHELDRGAGDQPGRGPEPARARTSAPTTSTRSGRSTASTGATSSATTGCRIVNKCQRNAPEGAPATGEAPAPAGGAEGGGAPAGGGGESRPSRSQPARSGVLRKLRPSFSNVRLQQSRSGETMISQLRFSRGIFARALLRCRPSCWLRRSRRPRRQAETDASRPTAARRKLHEAGDGGQGDADQPDQAGRAAAAEEGDRARP